MFDTHYVSRDLGAVQSFQHFTGRTETNLVMESTTFEDPPPSPKVVLINICRAKLMHTC